MKTPIRYTVINEDGRPVIRAVPVPRRLDTTINQSNISEVRGDAAERRGQMILRRICSMRLLDSR
jgi:hypothetical protein